MRQGQTWSYRIMWMQKFDNMSSLFIFLIINVCKQRHENSKCSMILNLFFSIKGEIIFTGGVAKYLQWLIAKWS